MSDEHDHGHSHSDDLVQHAIPILCVRNFAASMKHYCDVLGFHKHWDWGEPPTFGSVSRGGVEFFLGEQCQGQPGTWIYLTVSDVDALHRELQARGAKIRETPNDKPWHMREMLVEDPDGHVLRFGHGLQHD